MKIIVGASKKKFNPYQAVLSTMEFLASFGALIGLVVGAGLFLFGFVAVPGNPTSPTESVIVAAAIVGALVAFICAIIVGSKALNWIFDDGWRDFKRNLRYKADNYGKVEDR